MNKNVLKFAANISTMFREVELLDRILECSLAGFSAFEAQHLYDIEKDEFLALKEISNLTMILINSPSDVDGDKSSFGYACVPGKEKDFWKSFMQAVQFAKEAHCKKIHILAGLKYENDFSTMRLTYINNLKKAAEVLEKEKIVGVIEPLCFEVKPNYFLDSFDLAVEIIKEVNSDFIKLLLDIFHLEMIHGDSINLINRYYPYAGHVQVSQAPSREEPSAEGSINYDEIFQFLKAKNHLDYIGLEYTPKRPTVESLEFWRSNENFR